MNLQLKNWKNVRLGVALFHGASKVSIYNNCCFSLWWWWKSVVNIVVNIKVFSVELESLAWTWVSQFDTHEYCFLASSSQYDTRKDSLLYSFFWGSRNIRFFQTLSDNGASKTASRWENEKIKGVGTSSTLFAEMPSGIKKSWKIKMHLSGEVAGEKRKIWFIGSIFRNCHSDFFIRLRQSQWIDFGGFWFHYGWYDFRHSLFVRSWRRDFDDHKFHDEFIFQLHSEKDYLTHEHQDHTQ